MVSGRLTILAVAPPAGLAADIQAELGAWYTLRVAADLDEALAVLRGDEEIAVALCPERFSGTTAIAAAGEIVGVRPELPVLVLAPLPETRDLTAATNGRQIAGAVQVPWRRWELASTVQRVYELARLRGEVHGLNRKMHRRFEALAAMNELAAATADLRSYAELARVLARGLFRVVRSGVSAVMLAAGAEAERATLHVHSHKPSGPDVLRAARDRCIDILRSLTGRAVDEDQLAVAISGERLAEDSGAHGELTHVPIHLDGTVVGVMLVTSYEGSLTVDDEKLLYYLAARASESVERLRARLHDERRRLGLMVEAMADGLILTDAGSDRVLINPAARRMLGIEAARDVTTQFLKERLGFYPFDLVAARPSAADDSEPLREEVRVGEQLLHSIVSPVRDGAGQLVGVVTVLRDITEARELARRQSEFVSVVSHELRTPLTSIAGALDIVLSGYAGKLSDKQDRYLRMARDSCNGLNSIVDDLLDVARSDTGGMSVTFTPLGLDELAAEVVGRYQSAAHAKEVQLELRAEEGPIRIVGDSDRLTQVLTNLLSNAIKFTPHGGRIDVEVFGPSVASDHVGVSVFNNGEPIPEDARERIFDKFEQLEQSSTRKVGGTGLGLAISRAIVEAHGGRIWVESSDEGTRFVFTLPVAPADEEIGEIIVEPDSVRRAPAVESDVHVLVVDDDPHSIYILKGMLMASGFEVHVASDSDGALAVARENRLGLVVVSGALTGADPIALVEILAHDPDTRKSSVLLIAAEGQRAAALGAGAAEVLERPIRPKEFRDTTARLVAEASRAQSRKILVVDDDPTIRGICGEILEHAGFTVRDVSSGHEALAEAKRFRPDLALLDVMMPVMNGFETAERFRGDTATSMMPIIFLSARGETADKVRAFRSGAEDYVVKPFDAAELVARVTKALERHTRELGASPTTQLPGADAIEAEIDRRLAVIDDSAFCYLDLDNLKAFNDYYGYAKADGVIRQTGDLIRDIVAREGTPGDFIGHIAGDDFVFVTTADRVDAVCVTICNTFDRLVPLYYNKTDRERGFIETQDRYGVLRKFPIMTISIAAVTRRDPSVRSFSDLASAAARGKKKAKSLISSSYVRDGRPILGHQGEQSGELAVPGSG